MVLEIHSIHRMVGRQEKDFFLPWDPWNWQNHGVDDLLASLLGQLVLWKKSTIPEAIREWYDKHLKGEKPRLSRDEIRVALGSIIRTYSRTFVISIVWMNSRPD